MRNWIRNEQAASGSKGTAGSGAGESSKQELIRLRRENAQLRKANEILKTASAFRRGGARPQTPVIVDYVRAHASRLGVEPICTVLSEHGIQIAPSSCYYAYRERGFSPTDAELDDAYAANALFDRGRRIGGYTGG